MTSISKKIEQEVLSLPAHERILIDRLIESLNLPTEPDIDRLWAEEGEKRFLTWKPDLLPRYPEARYFPILKVLFPNEFLFSSRRRTGTPSGSIIV